MYRKTFLQALAWASVGYMVPSEAASARAAASDPVTFAEQPTASGHRIGFATLSPQGDNKTLTVQMLELMQAKFRDWKSDEGIVAVVLRGSDDKTFCAGGDIVSVVQAVRKGGADRFVYGERYFAAHYPLDLFIHTFGKPFIAYSSGVCKGAGLGLMQAASHRIVAEGSQLAMPEIGIGMHVDAGGAYFLNRVPGNIGLVMALTALELNEADAIHANLADAFVPLRLRDALLADLLGRPWTGDAARDRALVSELVGDYDRRALPERGASPWSARYDALRGMAALPGPEAIRDALQAAAARDSYYQTAAQTLAKASPTAALTMSEYIRRSRQRSVSQVLASDQKMGAAALRGHDLVEAISALYIDRDRQPKWSPDSYAGASVAGIAAAVRDAMAQ